MLSVIKRKLTLKKAVKQQADKRLKRRFAKKVPAKFQLNNEPVSYKGKTTNLTLKSVYLKIDSSFCVQNGDVGLMSIGNELEEFKCCVTRHDDNGMVLSIVNEKASLTKFLPRKSSFCQTCGRKNKELHFCPSCNGLHTVCNVCLKKDGSCQSCRADDLIYRSRHDPSSV